MKQISVIIFFFLVGYNNLQAQNVRFPTSGIIEFEKSINMHAIIKRNIGSSNDSFMQQAYNQYKESQPQFKILQSTLTFSDNKTLFTPIASTTSRGGFMDNMGAEQNNIILNDLNTNTFIAQKKIYEELFLVKDSIRKINWKITSETREIAGYECRRANALILDSVYVVAFYTDKIPVSGGPESFSGLPGMILGVALPHENITWFAKTIKDTTVSDAQLKAPSKGKPVNNEGLIKTINEAFKGWGGTSLKAFML